MRLKCLNWLVLVDSFQKLWSYLKSVRMRENTVRKTPNLNTFHVVDNSFLFGKYENLWLRCFCIVTKNHSLPIVCDYDEIKCFVLY